MAETMSLNLGVGSAITLARADVSNDITDHLSDVSSDASSTGSRSRSNSQEDLLSSRGEEPTASLAPLKRTSSITAQDSGFGRGSSVVSAARTPSSSSTCTTTTSVFPSTSTGSSTSGSSSSSSNRACTNSCTSICVSSSDRASVNSITNSNCASSNSNSNSNSSSSNSSRRASTILSLPDEALIGILRHVSSSQRDLSFATVCSRFQSLLAESVSSVHVGPTKLLSEDAFIHSLSALPRINSLVLSRESVDRMSDAILQLVASKAGTLERVSLVFTRDCSATGAELASTLRRCCALRWLSLEGWSKGCIPDVFHSLSGLERLTLELPCNVLPESIGSLPNLRFLEVSRRYGRNVRIPESLTKLSSLEEFSIDCWDLAGAQDSIAALSSLTSLHLALRFPYQLPWSLEGLSNLTRLSLSCRYLEVLPAGTMALEKLESLSLVCPFLTSLPPTVSLLQKLRTLEVSVRGCLRLPADMWRLDQLEELKLKCRHLVPSSPWAFSQLPKLQSLSVKCSAVAPSADHAAGEGLQTIFPDDFGLLSSSLVSLNLRSERMDRLPESLGQLERLRRLTLGADEPDYLWEPMLKLRPRECLRALPMSLASLHGLEELHVVKCSRLANLPPNLGQLVQLRTIAVRECPRLEGIPASIGQLHSLEELDIDNCGARRFRFTLPDCFGDLSALRKVKVSSPKLTVFPASLLALTQLESLTIGCSVVDLPDAFHPSSNLKELMFSNCRRLRQLPRSLGTLQKLEALGIRDCKALRKIPEAIGQLKGLKKLQIVQCAAGYLPDCFGLLTSLEDLYINLKLKALPKSFSSLVGLKQLHLRGFRMKTLPVVVSQLRGLQSLTVCGWPKLEAVPESVVRLVHLQKLMICCCPRLRSLPRAILNMPNLSRGCRELLALEFDLPWLQPEDMELAHNCDWLQ